ncbi:portal protein [Pseudolabrys sp.]|uniref:portal protein n=1 Tax=Pseudolabrys sp. TaxID=1960880 RepID=UPI003D0DF240
MANTLPAQGVLRVVPNAALTAAEQARDKALADANTPSEPAMTNLASHIRTQYETFRNHRNNSTAGWNDRLMSALRAFNGQYDASKLAEIRKFGGSEVYARIISMKCRGASSLLRDVYLAPDRPWGLDPPADPDIPPEITSSIQELVQIELQSMEAAGTQTDPNMIRDRVNQLMDGARDAAKKRAERQAKIAEDKIDEILTEGNFYKAVAEFLVDVPMFPFACIKGPVVRIVPTVVWTGGQASIQQKPKLFWVRVSPFDLYWTPGVSDVEDAEVIERTRLTRADLNDLLDLPGYNHDEVRAVLDEYGQGGLNDNWDSIDSERADQENRENPFLNKSGLISCLEYHGNVQGKTLLEQGMDAKLITDPLRDYMVQAWLVGRHVIKVQLSPSPRKRHPYFITSFEKVPGTPVGNGLPDILSDIQEVCNASIRALVNNLSISSGPQVVINDDRLSNDAASDDLYPWKRWHVQSDPMANNTQDPISFFQPVSNAQDLLSIYARFNDVADEVSAIPKYLSGNSPGGGAGRTAAGLAMLMGNASKILQTVAANIDRDVFEPCLTGLFDMLMLTDTSGFLTGQESVKVMGVNVAVQRETQRSRQLEFLQATANPIDAQIMGPNGRAKVLRSVAQTIGIEGEEIVPDDNELEQMKQNMAALGAQAQGDQAGPGATQDMGPRTRIAGGVG